MKLFFYSLNIIIIILYLSPCSIFGYFLYDDCSHQPQITKDFIVSSNHVYTFILLSSIGLNAFKNNLKNVISYLIFASIFLEFCHLFIEDRAFQKEDLFGNIIGVIISILIFKFFKKGIFK